MSGWDRICASRIAICCAVIAAACWIPFNTALAAPGDWTLSKTASPTTYTAAGQVITYTYVITNVSGGNGSLTTLNDDKATVTDCPAGTPVPPAGRTCHGTYTITAADLTAGSVTNNAAAIGDSCNDGCAITATATATVTFVGQPSWTLAKTPNPTTYTAAGQSIAYSYLLTNTGNVSISAISLSDNKVSPVGCPATTLAAGASVTCTGNYSTTAADVAAGSVTNTATATGTPAAGILAPATAQATINLTAQPAWTLTKTPSPTTYTAAGQSIAYGYVLTNTSNVSISAISLSDNRVSPVSCPAATLAAGASVTCTGSYSTTAADVVAGSVTNTATATGTPAVGTLTPATAQATVRLMQVSGSITIVKFASGGNNAFNFTSSVAGAASFTLTTAGGMATRSFTTLNPGTYTFAEVNLPPHWRLSALTCTGEAGGTPTTANVAAGSVSVGLDGGEAIICTFSNTFDAGLHIQQTQAVISRFLSRRVSLLASEEPDRPRLLRRLSGSLWGGSDTTNQGGAPSQPFNFSGNSSALSSQMSFSTSLSQATAYAEAHAEASKRLAGGGKREASPQMTASRFDVWIEAHFNQYGGDFNGPRNRGRFNIVYVGADYLVTNAILVGALAQFDWMNESSAVQQSSVNGSGVMAGPYLSAKLTPNLYFDTRFAWGVSDNTVNPFGLYHDKFATDRWLAHAKFTGNWWSGNFRITPSAGVTFVGEHQHNYIDSLGLPIPDQTVSLGRFAFGPELAYRIKGNDGLIYEPNIQIRGTWDFIKPSATTVGGFLVGNDSWRAQIQGGVVARWPSGYSVRVAGQYDGVGSSSLHAYGGQFWLSVPLSASAP